MNNRILVFILVAVSAICIASSCKKEKPTEKPEDEVEDVFYDGPQEDPNAPPVLTEVEETIHNTLTNSEEDSPVTVYSEEQALRLDSLARDFLERNDLLTKASKELDQGNKLNGYVVEHEVWDSGDWGASHWAGDKIVLGFDADYNGKGEKVISIFLFRKGGFQEGNVYLKLGTLNSGKVLTNIQVSEGQQYVAMEYNIDKTIVLDGNKQKSVELLPGYGILNLFPLIVYKNKYREYLNQVIIKSDPIVPKGWDSKSNDVGYLFGTINGVPLFHNGTSVKDGKTKYNMNSDDISTHPYQCVNLCVRYLKTHYDLINKDKTYGWGDAKEWPDKREEETNNGGDKYIVLKNDGINRAREGDLVVFGWTNPKYGHIGVIIKTLHNSKDNYISFAHQNAGIELENRPIGTVQKRNGDFVIESGSRKVTHFIRKYNVYEEPNNNITYEEPNVKEEPSMSISPNPVNFGQVTLGDYHVERVTITNNGTGTLVISSITPPEGYSWRTTSGTVAPNGGVLTIPVRFEPSEARKYDGDCILQTNLGKKVLRFTGKGVETARPGITLSPSSLNFGEVTVGQSKGNEAGRVKITNTGTADLVISGIDCPAGFSHSSTLNFPQRIAAGDSWTVTFVFRPTQEKSYGGNIVFHSNAGDAQVSVTGKGVEAVAGAVDLGLSVRWASCNLGASSPEEYGDYYAWGETSKKENYSMTNYKWWTSDFVSDLNNYKAASGKILRYNNGSKWGSVDNRMTLLLSDDAARVNLGAPWRMPTWDEMMELKYKCTWKWTTYKSVPGYRVTGPNGKWIFLPAAGLWMNGGIDSIYPIGKRGAYWSSSLNEYTDTNNGRVPYPVVANHLDLSQSSVGEGGGVRCYGESIRPVCD